MNPAGIGDLGKFRVTGGVHYVESNANRTGYNGTSDTMDTGHHLIPDFAAAASAGMFGFGVAMESPYGLGTQWADQGNTRYVATKSSLKMFDLSPAVSVRPNEKVAVGFGMDYFSTFSTDLQKKVATDVLNAGLGFPTLGAGDANSRLTGDGHAWGYHTGILYNPSPSHTFGVTYHSAVKTKIEGSLEIDGLSGASAALFGGSSYRTNARTDLFYPQNVQMGYKYSHADKWEAGFNVAYYNWSQNKELAIHTGETGGDLASATRKSVIEQPIPLQWRDVWSGTVGGFYRFTDHWKVNAGAYYLPYVYPDVSFSPAVPDMNKIGFSIGPSFNAGGLTIDTVYNPLFYLSRDVHNNLGQNAVGGASSPLAPGADISGHYKAFVQIVGINVGWKF